MKWIALALIVVGLWLFLRGISADSKASFHDGGFIVVVLQIIGGVVLTGIGLVIFAALIFMAL